MLASAPAETKEIGLYFHYVQAGLRTRANAKCKFSMPICTEAADALVGADDVLEDGSTIADAARGHSG
jgi:hypothetical protein